ncbi:MAG: MFS transporter [Pirellulales bacterium]|nr:MFS transporter [Pirellulales bacterium]
MNPSTNHRAVELRRWQYRIFAGIWITYFTYYLCRVNMPVAGDPLCKQFGWSNTQFGYVVSALTVMYAIGQFINGQLADRFGSRAIASLGAFGSVAINLAIYGLLLGGSFFSENPRMILIYLIGLWGINGFFQAMGWSPMVRMMAHWYPDRHRGNIMGALGTCYQFGAAFANLLALFLIGYYVTRLQGDWRMVFLVPAALFALVGAGFYLLVRNRPEDVGLPPVNLEEPSSHPADSGGKDLLIRNVMQTLSNPFLWIVAGSFLFLDITRYGFINWLPMYLTERHVQQSSELIEQFKLIVKVCVLPLGGSVGVILAGWATDRFFGSRRAPVIAIFLVLLGLLSAAFPFIPTQNTVAMIAVLGLVGICTYGPHILMVGHAAQDFGKKSNAAGAAGFIDALGYVGASLAGAPAGLLIDKFGFTAAFITFGIMAILGALLACVLWTVHPTAPSPSTTPRR